MIDSQENGSGYLFIKLILAFYIILRAAKAILGNYFETVGIQWYECSILEPCFVYFKWRFERRKDVILTWF